MNLHGRFSLLCYFLLLSNYFCTITTHFPRFVLLWPGGHAAFIALMSRLEPNMFADSIWTSFPLGFITLNSVGWSWLRLSLLEYDIEHSLRWPKIIKTINSEYISIPHVINLFISRSHYWIIVRAKIFKFSLLLTFWTYIDKSTIGILPSIFVFHEFE